jgi:acyl dehydratase
VTRYFEDFAIGEVIECGKRTVSAEEIHSFAEQFDPQPFHLDEAAAKQGMFGGIVASGWHSVCIAMRLAVDALFNETSNMGSPGVDKIRFLRPMFPGDTVTARVHVVDAVPSSSKPDRGRLTFRFELFNQKAEMIMDLQAMTILGRRPASLAPAGAAGG